MDDFGTPHDLETTLDSKLTVESKLTSVYYSNNRKITLDCYDSDTACVTFYSNDTNTRNMTYDCKMVSQGGVNGLDGKGSSLYVTTRRLFMVMWVYTKTI